MKKFLLSLATAFSFVLFLGSCTNEEDINNNGYSDWKIQCKLPPKTKRFCPLVLK